MSKVSIVYSAVLPPSLLVLLNLDRFHHHHHHHHHHHINNWYSLKPLLSHPITWTTILYVITLGLVIPALIIIKATLTFVTYDPLYHFRITSLLSRLSSPPRKKWKCFEYNISNIILKGTLFTFILVQKSCRRWAIDLKFFIHNLASIAEWRPLLSSSTST